MPVGKLLISMSLPMMISMLVQALYNVVDSYFVAKLSQDALNAVSLSFPIQNLLIAVSVGTGTPGAHIGACFPYEIHLKQQIPIGKIFISLVLPWVAIFPLLC